MQGRCSGQALRGPGSTLQAPAAAGQRRCSGQGRYGGPAAALQAPAAAGQRRYSGQGRCSGQGVAAASSCCSDQQQLQRPAAVAAARSGCSDANTLREARGNRSANIIIDIYIYM